MGHDIDNKNVSRLANLEHSLLILWAVELQGRHIWKSVPAVRYLSFLEEQSREMVATGWEVVELFTPGSYD